ncbi:phospho-2-dehydro-3-deoxyheptonate aldolase [Anabaena cylindrica PCC 7122]|nr:phospho-2-dehydro-3-deoxyheptonate aldolase [Anabaena cylindrica PCC 7122]
MASGLSIPVGFKNGTDGNIQVAFDAMQSANKFHHFLGIDQMGKVCTFKAKGNIYGHIILRGGDGKPNFDAPNLAWVEKKLEGLNLPKRIVVDCSHGNSYKDHKLQNRVFKNVLN